MEGAVIRTEQPALTKEEFRVLFGFDFINENEYHSQKMKQLMEELPHVLIGQDEVEVEGEPVEIQSPEVEYNVAVLSQAHSGEDFEAEDVMGVEWMHGPALNKEKFETLFGFSYINTNENESPEVERVMEELAQARIEEAMEALNVEEAADAA